MSGFLIHTLLFSVASIGLTIGSLVSKWGPAFTLLYWTAFGALAGIIYCFPTRWSNRQALWFIFLFAVTFRIVFIGFQTSSDVNRYVWEGYIQSRGFNPYALAPNDPTLAHLTSGPMHDIWQYINHNDAPACYPPLAMLLFRLLAKVFPDPFFFKIIMAFFDAAVLLPLVFMIRHSKLPLKHLMWYVGNPLLLVFIAGEGHLDSFMVLLLCTGIVLFLQHRPGLGFFCIGCAAMAKYFALLALPFLLHRNNWQKSWLALLPGIFFLPYIDAGFGIFHSLSVFGLDMHYNDSIAAVLRLFLGHYAVAASGFILAIGLVLIFMTVHNRLRSLFLAFGCLLICLPTLHPWYLILIAPFAAAFASPSWLFLQASVAFTFPVLAAEYTGGVFQEIPWLKLFEYIPFMAILMWSAFRGGMQTGRRFGRVTTLSVVIPTLNEAEFLGQCLKSVCAQAGVHEVIIADAGSDDETCDIGEQFGATVICCPKGRGVQIREGIKAASGDVIMILHADCLLHQGTPQRIIERLNHDRSLAGGALAMAFKPNTGRKRIISYLNNHRASLAGIAFGDQGQFFRTEVLPVIGGFPDQMLMEDVELSLRLKEAGRLLFLKKGIAVSGRRWEKRSFTANVATVVRLLFRYLIERRLGWVKTDASNYYQRYYGNIS